MKDWLPLPQSSTTNGSYYTLPSTSVATSVYGDPLLYAEKELENSPLDRVLQQAAPGTPWSLASGKTQKLGYQVNLSSDNVKRYVTTTTWSGNATLSTLKIFTTTASENSTYYPASSLYKNKVTDENGNISYEFKNGQGQTLLLRKMEGTTPVDTYYVYNEYDQLAFVLAPLASDATKALGSGASVSASTLDELCYQYRYDGRSRMVEKKLPGKGWEYIVYDNQDRVVMTQDAQMRPTNQWLFTKYDRFSRVVYTGITSAGTRAVEQSTLNSKTANHETRASTPFTNSGSSVYYTNTAYPVATASSKVMTVQYYDTYPPESPSKPAVIVSSSQPTLNPTATSYRVNGYTSSRSTKGLPTAHYIKNTEDNGWTKNYTWYDTKGKALSTHSYNPLGGHTKTDNLLDFSGVPTYSYTYHKRLNADPQITVRNRFLYDAQNRLTHHYHQINSLPEELLAAHSYSEVGAILTKKVGTGTLQEINYTYNVRGWMTGINNTLSLGTDLFALTLRYHNPQSHPYALAQYNGNIAQIDWITKNGTSPELRRYSYNYDGLDRLLKAYYSKPSAQTTNTNAYNEYLTYDQNGNIKSLSRYGSVDGSVALIIDQLQYSYTGNRLIKVLDNSGNTLQGYPQGGSTITYDSNGNMTQHMDKGISLIEYNYLNLPKSITQAVGNTTYNYRADGIKLRKTYSTKTTDYLDGFQYETLGASTNLQFLTTAEGYYDMAKNAYIYNYLDHLGNVRLSYRKNSSGVLEIVEENNYYPFGLKHEGYNNLSTATLSYKYKYNGKELQETGMYDYGARFYMPDIGRWGVVDGLSEGRPNMSPYRYSFNNPVNATDPNGLWEGWVESEVDGQKSIAYDPHVNSKQEAIDKGYAGVTNYYDAATVIGKDSNGNQVFQYNLDSAGVATDSSGNVMGSSFKAGDVSIGVNPDSQMIASIRSMSSSSLGGMGAELKLSQIYGVGYSVAIGYVSANGNNGSSFYITPSVGVGLDSGLSFSLFSVNPQSNGHDFNVHDFKGNGMSYNGSVPILGTSYGGSDNTNGFQVQDMNPQNFGLGRTGYTTTGVGLNWGAGASYQYGKTLLFGTTQPKK